MHTETRTVKTNAGAGQTAAPLGEALDRLADIFKMLGDPGRLRIVHSLLRRELCVYDLAAEVEMSASAVSHQLRGLRNLKLVKRRRDGQKIYYSLDDQHIATILSQGIDHVEEV